MTLPMVSALRNRLYADPKGVFVHDAILMKCRALPKQTCIVDTSELSGGRSRRITYGEYGDLVERAAAGFIAAGVRPGDVIGIYLFNCWEYPVAYHAATLAGGVPTLLNPSYREREVRFQLENSGTTLLVSDAPQIAGINLGGLPRLRRIYTTRRHEGGNATFAELLASRSLNPPRPDKSPEEALAALPYSSGTTGLPKGVMLSHLNLVVNAYQTIRPGEQAGYCAEDVFLCFLPLYHIYGLNVVLNSVLLSGGTLVLMPRFDAQKASDVIMQEGITYTMLVPPAMNALSVAAEQGVFPKKHSVRVTKCGAAPLAPQVAERFERDTGIPIAQGYGMTEASPVTHLGFIEPEFYRPDSIGFPAFQTECRVLDEGGSEAAAGESGELVMRGPQFMSGYWKAPEATAEVLHDGWYFSGDVARRDERGFYFIVDRRKEMIKYKGFPMAPAEIEAVLLEHPAVRDCGIVGKADECAGEIPVAFVVLRDTQKASVQMQSELSGYVGERLVNYKQPREVRFVDSIPRNPSGKILRRELRSQL